MTVVTVHVWHIARGALPKALWRMAVDRGRLRRTPGVRFAKLLGTGRGRDFGPTAIDSRRWAALVVWDGEPVPIARAWDRLAVRRCQLTLRTIASRGTWAGREPFSRAEGEIDRKHPDGPVLVLTRARLRPGRAVTFWRAVPDVARSLGDAPGLLAAFGVGEAPLGFQGTMSIWNAPEDIVRFAYRRPEHAAVVASTPHRRWYAEELFARFAVLDVTGDREVIGWKASR